MKFAVPQFIDAEDKVLGPLTVRQFLIMLLSFGTMFLAYKTLDFVTFIIYSVFAFTLAGIFAFFKVNGQPFHYFVLNLLQTFRRPGLRIWDKTLDASELREIMRKPPPPPPRKKVIKEALGANKLNELSLIVNTGGVYNPEE